MFNKLKEQETHKLTIPFKNLKELSNYDQTAKEKFWNTIFFKRKLDKLY